MVEQLSAQKRIREILIWAILILLLVPLALAGGGEFVTLDPSQHMRTNIEVIKTFLDIDVSLQQQAPDVCRVLVG